MGRQEITIQSLVEAIRARNAEYSEVRGRESDQRLAGPATKAQIEKLEQVAGTRLPADYLEFLQLHNGWENFYADYSLLSTEQMVSGGSMAKRLQQLKELLAENPKTARQKPFIVLAGPFGKFTGYFDRSVKMEFVEWDPSGEIDRHKSFTAYLQASNRRLEEVIKSERKKLRR
jgi:hypothetical protein